MGKLWMTVLVVYFCAVYWADAQIEGPALGDVMLELDDPSVPYKGRVLIYLAAKTGIPEWGTICHSDSFQHADAEVICQQLGYEGDDAFATGRFHKNNLTTSFTTCSNYSIPTWLYELQCSDTGLQHVLRCDYKLNTSSNSEQCEPYKDVHLDCKSDTKVWDNAYQGEVRLCRDVSVSYPSRGVVQVYNKDDWGDVNNPKEELNFGSYEADAVCRQLGYTQAVPGSVVKTGTPDLCMDVAEELLNTSLVKCENPSACFGCCYVVSEAKCGSKCNPINSIALQCMYDIHNDAQPSSGGEDVCTLPNNPTDKLSDTMCGTDSESKKTHSCTDYETAMIFLIILFSLALVAICVLGAFALKRCFRSNNGEEKPLVGEKDGEQN